MTHSHSHRDPACLEVFARLSEYIDGELPGADCAGIESHVADCPPCVEFIRSLKRCVEVSKGFHSAEDCPPVPPEMEQKLRAAWQAALTRKR
ncbi:MAG: zf-HC2 domain-containing protein [Candidatus Solibacter usitatus]|nr:zf-HC2 domain-containing protein [Candidatus Solibacter usitatus]